MLYNSNNIINISTIFSCDKYHTLYRFNNGYGASVIHYFNSDDVEISVLSFFGEDILEHVITTDTSLTKSPLIYLKTNEFTNKMIQIENLI